MNQGIPAIHSLQNVAVKVNAHTHPVVGSLAGGDGREKPSD